LPEVAHPVMAWKQAGFEITFVSPKGGLAPMDEGSGIDYKDDKISQDFLASPLHSQLSHTLRPEDINSTDYDAIFYAGGHGPMWDVALDEKIAHLAISIYEKGGVVSAVCHGPAGLVPIKNPDGSPFVKGKTVSSFTNEEETAVALEKVVPFHLETRLRELGANFHGGPKWEANVQVDGRLVTGQNPKSAEPLAHQVARILNPEVKFL